MPEAIVDFLEIININHRQRIFSAQVTHPFIIIPAIIYSCCRIHINLPVPHKQLIQNVLAFYAVDILRTNRVHTFQRIGHSVYLDWHCKYIINIIANRLHLRLYLSHTDGILRNAALTAARFPPEGKAILVLLHRMTLLCCRNLHTDFRVHQPNRFKHRPISLQHRANLLFRNPNHIFSTRQNGQQHLLLQSRLRCFGIIHLYSLIVFINIYNFSEQRAIMSLAVPLARNQNGGLALSRLSV